MMWYPASITVAAAAEPVTLAEAKAQCRIDDTSSDTILGIQIAAARAHVEAYCGVRFAEQTVAIKCDNFDDFAWLPEAPVQSITSITYVDTAGATQTLADTVYEERFDGLSAEIVLKHGQTWPAIQPGSRITVTAVVGYEEVPESVKQAMLLLIGFWFENRETVNVGNITTALPFGTDALLANHRRNA